MQGLTETQLLLEVIALKRKEDRWSKMIGEQLGSYLPIDSLDSLLGISNPVESKEASSVNQATSVESLPKAISLPLAFSIRPELQDVYKERAKEILDRRAELEYTPSDAEDSFHLRKYDLDLLEAVSRLAQKRKKEVADMGGSEESLSEDASLGIYPPGGAPIG